MRISRHIGSERGIVIPVAAVLLVSGCSAGGASTGASGGSGPAPAASAQRVRLASQGDGTRITGTVRVPSSAWTVFKGFAVTDDASGVSRAVSLWKVGKVAKDPCHSVGRLVDPGPTVADLVTALEAQKGRHASPPQSVVLAGHPAIYLTWSVPDDAVVTGDSDFTACDAQDDGHRDFLSWEGAGGQGARWQQMAGQVDELWVLEVGGQRLVVDAAHSPNASPAQVEEEDGVVRSLQLGTAA